MIFVDSNIPMYLVGESHPHKFDTQRMLEQAVSANGIRLHSQYRYMHENDDRY